MRRVGDILSNSNDQIGQIMKIRQHWKDIAGEVLANHSEPVLIKKRVLQVICDSPAWAQQIGMMTKVVEKQIKDITGLKVLKVEGQFGMVKRNPVKENTQRPFTKPDIDPEDVKKIKDPRLAEAVLELINLKGK
jgi:hypothetical protein